MPVLINSGAVLTVDAVTGLILGDDGTIASGGLLTGSGTVTGGFTLLNQGTIAPDQMGGVLNINTGTLVNAGTIRAHDGSLSIGSSVVAADLAGTTLTRGVWEASGTSDLRLLAGQIGTNAATITLDGADARFNGFNRGLNAAQPLESSLTAIGPSGVLNVWGGRDFQTVNAFQVDGTVTLGGGMLFALGGVTIGPGGMLSGFGAIQPGLRDDGAVMAQGGTLSLPEAASFSGTGTLGVGAGATLALQAPGSYTQGIVNNGTIAVLNAGNSGTLVLGGPYQGTGGFLIQGGASGASLTVLDLPGSVAADVAFDTNFGELRLEAPASYTGRLSGFAENGTVVLGGMSADGAVLSGNTLSLFHQGAAVQTLRLDTDAVNYSQAVFRLNPRGPNDTALTVTGLAAATACYRAGTRIATARGEVRVEDLAVGDQALTWFSGPVPILWIGHRRVDCRRHPAPAQVWPVRVAAHAFGLGLPRTALWLSPDHAVFTDGVLIPIRHLINGATIVQMPVEEVVYHHVELEEHDVLIAEGLPAESYLENGGRGAFENGGEPIALHPVFGAWRWEAAGCAPLVITGPPLEAARARIAAWADQAARHTDHASDAGQS